MFTVFVHKHNFSKQSYSTVSRTAVTDKNKFSRRKLTKGLRIVQIRSKLQLPFHKINVESFSSSRYCILFSHNPYKRVGLPQILFSFLRYLNYIHQIEWTQQLKTQLEGFCYIVSIGCYRKTITFRDIPLTIPTVKCITEQERRKRIYQWLAYNM